MKVELNEKKETIEWGRSQLLRSTSGLIVISTGKHSQKEFSGIPIGGLLCDSLVKEGFELLPRNVSITISND